MSENCNNKEEVEENSRASEYVMSVQNKVEGDNAKLETQNVEEIDMRTLDKVMQCTMTDELSSQNNATIIKEIKLEMMK